MLRRVGCVVIPSPRNRLVEFVKNVGVDPQRPICAQDGQRRRPSTARFFRLQMVPEAGNGVVDAFALRIAVPSKVDVDRDKLPRGVGDDTEEKKEDFK